jgi:hypothetical protein
MPSLVQENNSPGERAINSQIRRQSHRNNVNEFTAIGVFSSPCQVAATSPVFGFDIHAPDGFAVMPPPCWSAKTENQNGYQAQYVGLNHVSLSDFYSVVRSSNPRKAAA